MIRSWRICVLFKDILSSFERVNLSVFNFVNQHSLYKSRRKKFNLEFIISIHKQGPDAFKIDSVQPSLSTYCCVPDMSIRSCTAVQTSPQNAYIIEQINLTTCGLRLANKAKSGWQNSFGLETTSLGGQNMHNPRSYQSQNRLAFNARRWSWHLNFSPSISSSLYLSQACDASLPFHSPRSSQTKSTFVSFSKLGKVSV